MRLSDIRPRRDDAPLPDDVASELEALDAALRGDEVPAGMEGLETLVHDLRAERPDAPPEFGAALDAWAAAGFPRGGRPGLGGTAEKAPSAWRARLDRLAPRRLMPVAATVTAVVFAAVLVARFDEFTGDDGADDGAEVTGVSEGGGEAVAEPATVPEGAPAVSDEAGADSTAAGEPEARDDVTFATPLSGSSGDPDRRALNEALDYAGAAQANRGGLRAARGVENRKVERDASLTLAAPADDVQDVTNEAIGVVNAHRGIVLSSQSSGTEDSARATLELLIPTANLDAALEDLSGLADVKSLSEGQLDITKPFVDARERLRGLRAERKSLIAQIKAATTPEQLAQLRAALDRVQEAVARANAELDNVQRRARLSQVTLQITSEGASEGDWSLDDALDDAGRVLTVAAGVALITAAVLLPIALLAAIAFFTVAAAKRRARERTLDE